MRILPPLASGTVLLALLPLAVHGQSRVLTISLGGMNAATVADVQDGVRHDLGSVTPSRPFPLDFAAINSVKGKKYDVAMHQTAAGDNTILLLGKGEHDAACDASREGAGQPQDDGKDRCVILGTVTDGVTATFGVSSTAGVLSLVTKSYPRPRFTLGVEANYKSFGKLGDVACDITALSSCTVDDKAIGVGGFAEYQVIPGLSLGARYERSSYQVTQMNGETAIHDVTLNQFDFYGALHPFGEGLFRPYFLAGWGIWVNRAELTLDGTFLEDRSQSGGRVFGGAGLDFPLFGGLGGRASAGYGSGGSNDADTNFRLGFALTRSF